MWLLSGWLTALLALFIYLITKSLLAGILVAIFFVIYGVCMDLCQKGIHKMTEDEIYVTRNRLPRGALKGRALLHAVMALSPFYLLYMVPSFIPLPSFSAWAMVQFGFIILAPLHFHTVGESYRDVTGIRHPFWIAQAVILCSLTVISLIIHEFAVAT